MRIEAPDAIHEFPIRDRSHRYAVSLFQVAETLWQDAGFDKEEVDSYVGEVCLKHRDWLNRLLCEARTWIGSEKSQAIKPKTHLPKGDPSEVVPRLARTLRVDLIVMGTVARTGIPGLIIGNTAESILSDIDCSLLAVKPEGFVTPIRVEKRAHERLVS